jgi:hypothetical protein
MYDFKVEGFMLITPKGSYDLRSISSVQFEEYGMVDYDSGGWRCWFKGAPWLLASMWFFQFSISWNIPAIISALFGFYYIGSDYLRINCVCDGKKYTLYKDQWWISKLWGKDDKGRAKAKEIYEFINSSVQLAKSV